MHGHFDVQDLILDSVAEDAKGSSGIHAGIGVVVPAYRILETLNHPDLVKDRVEALERFSKRGAVPDSEEDPAKAPAEADDPQL